jgi:hypothetical protein
MWLLEWLFGRRKTYVDENGYLRFKGTDRLVHRDVAYRQIYLPKKRRYKLPFSKYQVHHRDGNKLNNDVSNLQILTKKRHKIKHTRSFFGKILREIFT